MNDTSTTAAQAQHELPLLAGIAGFIRWCEDLLHLLSGPLLALGLAIALVDLLTDGQLLAAFSALLYAWAVSQAVGVDVQIVASFDRARIAIRERRYWAVFGLLILGCVLAFVAWQSAQVFALQESAGITTAQALARLGMDSSTWLVERTALSVFLVCLAGWNRYHAPARTHGDERERLQQALELEPLRAQLGASKRARLVGGVRAAVSTAVTGHDSAQGIARKQTRPPTGPGTPNIRTAQVRNERAEGIITPAPALRALPGRTPEKAQSSQSSARVYKPIPNSVEGIARAAYAPGMTAKALASAAGIGMSAASKYRRLFEQEQAERAERTERDERAQ